MVMMMMMIIKYDDNKIRAHARPTRAPARAITHAHAARSPTHARTPAPPPAAPHPTARCQTTPHKSTRLRTACVCLRCSISLSLSTGTHRTPPHAERVERSLRAGPPWGDKQVRPPILAENTPSLPRHCRCRQRAVVSLLVCAHTTDALVSLTGSQFF